MGGQWSFDRESYMQMILGEIPAYERLQDALADATVGPRVRRVLDLGSGTGVTADRVLRRHPGATLTGIDSSDEMLAQARQLVPGATFEVNDLEDPLPDGRFDLVVSALAIHHLDDRAKSELFRRIASALSPGGRFAFLDVVVPTRSVDRPVPLEPGVDRPSTVDDLFDWLRMADLRPTLVVDEGDLAVVSAERPGPRHG